MQRLPSLVVFGAFAVLGCGTAVPSGGVSDEWRSPSGTFGSKTIDCVSFADAQRGFLTSLEGGLWSTSNGGLTWQQLDVSVAANGVGFSPGIADLWVVGSGPAFRSADQGATFSRLTLPSDFYGWAAFFGQRTALVTSEVGDRVYRTEDGGKVWAVHAFGRETLPGTRRLFTFGTHAWIVGGPISAPDGTAAHVAHSTDEGTTWSTTVLQDKAHDLKGGALSGGFARNDQDVWVVGAHRQVYHTTSGGEQWVQISGIPSSVDDLAGVAVVKGRVVLAGRSPNDEVVILESHDETTFTVTATLKAPLSADIRGLVATADGKVFIYGYAGLFFTKTY